MLCGGRGKNRLFGAKDDDYLSGRNGQVKVFGGKGKMSSEAVTVTTKFSVSFVVTSNEFLEVISKRRPVAFSTDLVGTLSKEEDGETPFTPPVQTMYAGT